MPPTCDATVVPRAARNGSRNAPVYHARSIPTGTQRLPNVPLNNVHVVHRPVFGSNDETAHAILARKDLKHLKIRRQVLFAAVRNNGSIQRSKKWFQSPMFCAWRRTNVTAFYGGVITNTGETCWRQEVMRVPLSSRHMQRAHDKRVSILV